MTTKFLEPSTAGLRKPTDPQKENGQIINPPRYAEFGGLDKASRVAQRNPLQIKKPNK
jgi:hypothetical protein